MTKNSIIETNYTGTNTTYIYKHTHTVTRLVSTFSNNLDILLFAYVIQGFKPFITSVVNQLSVNLKRVYDLGVKKIVVTALQPLGCLPGSTAEFSFQKCNGTQNLLVGFHNLLLQQAVAKLNNETKSSFIVLDLYTSFMSVLNNNGNHLGNYLLPKINYMANFVSPYS